MTVTDKKALRRQMRTRRRTLSPAERAAAAKRVATRIWPLLQAQSCEHIAVYLAFDGELDLQPLIQRLWAAGKQVYLPIVTRLAPQRLWFRPYLADSAMRRNRFGIPEPISGGMWPSRQLDVVLLPLTAFDRQGTRLGMGGGFYDRTFAYRRASLVSRPRLIGVGYQWQEVEQLVREPHDLPVQAIVTD
jgi:5-formyltetrahydrofolate cyclo-ligase